jgi:hypothetical protein
VRRSVTAMQQVLINFDSQENKSHKQEYLLASFDDVLVLITLIISLKTANADMPRIGIVGEQVI